MSGDWLGWVVSIPGYCMTLVHASRESLAKVFGKWFFDCDYTDVRATRLPGLDGKPITQENAREAGFQYEGDDDPDFVNDCNCHIC